MKKILVAMLAAAMALGTITGCGGDSNTGSAGGDNGGTAAKGNSNVNPAGEFPIVNDQITLNFYVEADMTEESLADLEDNKLLAYIEETTNIDLEFTFLNYSAEGKQKMILSFASGDYPDGAMMSWNTMMTKTDLMNYGASEGIVIPLNPYIEEYGQEIKNIFELRPEDVTAITAPDGNIYSIPRFTECGHCMAYPKMWFNYQWLENLGLEEPQTTEELYNVLKAFKTQDPNGNGKADEIGLTGCIDFSGAVEYWLMNSFIDCKAVNQSSDPRMFLAWIDDQVQFIANKDEYREGLEWIKKMYDEGLIDPANFTQADDSLLQQVQSGEDGVAVVGGYTVDHLSMGLDFNNVELASQYHALPPVEGPDGVRYQSYASPAAQLPSSGFVIFDTCENPEAAFRLADWFLGEEMTYNLHYGMKGYGWVEPEDGAKNIAGGEYKCEIINLPADATEEEEKEFNSYKIGFLTPTADLKERRDGWSPAVSGADDPLLDTQYEARLEWETQRVEDYYPEVSLPNNVFMNEEDAAEFAEIRLNINQCVVKNTSMFITGARSLDEWDAYCQELEDYGLERYVELYSKAYLGE